MEAFVGHKYDFKYNPLVYGKPVVSFKMAVIWSYDKSSSSLL